MFGRKPKPASPATPPAAEPVPPPVPPPAQSTAEATRAHHERFRDGIGALSLRDLETLLMSARNLAGLYYPEARTEAGFALYAMSPEAAALPLADRIPPTELRHYYGYKDGQWRDDLYLSSGRADVRAMKAILTEDGFDAMGGRILEFGCSAGRMLRHLEPEARKGEGGAGEVWGVDLHAAAIHWAQAHLSPPFHFLTNTTQPHLPFEDRYFDLIYAGSVWTHIGELGDAWLLEMRRLLRPGGRLYLTLSDEDTLAEVARTAPDHPSNGHVAALDAETGMLGRDWTAFVTRTTPWLQRCVYRREAWLDRVGRWMEVRIVRPRAYGWQTGVLLGKPGGPDRPAGPGGPL
jgi:SAM-dependent methyltransferase